MRLLLLSSLATVACSGPVSGPEPERPMSATLLPTASPLGLSGLTTDPAGNVWAIPERTREVIKLASHHGIAIEERVGLIGVPVGLETESITWLGGSIIAIGTEAAGDRSSDLILLATRANDNFVVTDSLSLSYAPWETVGVDNEGIEGICAAGGFLFAAGEVVLETESGPAAPLGIFNLGTRQWTHTTIALTSTSGKIAGLDCRQTDPSSGVVELVAIERHFDVRRVLSMTVSSEPPATSNLRIASDVSEAISDNIEGITFGDRSWLLVTDNYFRGRQDGPGKLIAVRGN